MKLLASALLLGAASASAPQQKILKNPFRGELPVQQPVQEDAEPVFGGWSKPLHAFSEMAKGITEDAKAAWDEVALHFPDAVDKSTFFSSPKPHSRKPDSKWDYVVKGADVQSVWVENADGEKERDVDGKLESYNLRAKKVDPRKLGVDTVKQFSGYLDDDENDKHLFYCE